MSPEKEGAAPEGPPHDLVRSRGQEPAEAPQDNLSTSHVLQDRPVLPNIQEKPLTLIERPVQDLLSAGLSERRLARYAPAAADGAVSTADMYLWNCALCEAFYLPLHFAEITSRNTIHSALLYKGEHWYENQTFRQLLDPHYRSELDKALADEREQHGGAVDAHHLVSALSMGFWQHMATVRFERFLFPRGIQKNFLHAPWQKKRQDLHDLVEGLRRWRNRIAHHNAIFDKGPAAKYQEALDLISWSSPDLSRWVAARSRVSQVINERPRGV
ncbi:MAG: Abi family protein [Rhodobacteraceae bacterium]|jgi:hypothetical protein|nr:Abi family protein [Paracoccaceae bacterium]